MNQLLDQSMKTTSFSLERLSNELGEKFDLERGITRLDEEMNCFTFPFHSETRGASHYSGEVLLPEEKDFVKSEFEENVHFRYAVFVPASLKKSDRAIVLLHGLNERSWEKYLPWAHQIVRLTGSPVILFPIAHHMNRAPEAWGVSRPMHRLSVLRQQQLGKIRNSSFVNAAISCRLDYAPELFVSSGMQSLIDLISLSGQIQKGLHPLFRRGAQVDFFSYSIGAFITEILLMADPGKLFSGSRAFFFCGGATFDQMDGRSKSILDNRAFSALSNYISTLDQNSCCEMITNQSFRLYIPSLWQAFLSMLNAENKPQFREELLSKLAPRIAAVGLKLDRVIPGEAIQKTLNRWGNGVQKLWIDHFAYPYTHETPFPLKNSKFVDQVEVAFLRVFSRAAAFLGSQG